MNFFKKLLTIFFLTIISPCYAVSEEAIVKNISFDNKQNIEILIDKKSDFKAYSLHNPERLVVDIANASFGNRFDEDSNFPSFVTGFRKSKSGNILRIVFDLNGKVSIKSSVFQKLKKEKFGKILVKAIPDFVNKPPISEESSISSDPLILAVLSPNIPQLENPTRNTSVTSLNSSEEVKYVVKKEGSVIATSVVAKASAPKKIPIIAIDAGHGGKDPGTIGDYARTKEKIITLAYARELGKHLMITKN